MSVYYNGAHSITFWDLSSFMDGIEMEPYPVNSWDDLHLIPSSRPSIMIPEPNIQIISIPGTNKRYDITDFLRGPLTHGKISGEWEFIIDYTKYDQWSEAYRQLLSTFHGKRMMLSLDDDPTKIYNGEIVVSGFNPGANFTTVTLQYDLDKGYYDVSDPYDPIPPSTRFPTDPPIYMRIRFIGMNGQTVSENYYLYGEYPTVPTAPSVSGYVFLGWDPPVDIVSHGQDYHAEYSSNTTDPTTKVTYRFLQQNGTSVITSGKVYPGSTPPTPSSSQIPVIEGYEFSNWNPAVSSISSNTDYVAQYTQLYLVRFLAQDETTVITSGYYANGATVTPPTPPEVTGYVFDHWDPTVTTVSGNQDYVAKYTQLYLVRFLAKDEETVLSSDYYASGATVTPPAPPEVPGYMFDHWEPTVTTVTGDQDYIARYIGETIVDDSKNLIEGAYVNYSNDEVTRIADYAFYQYSYTNSPLRNRLKTASFASCSYIGEYAFYRCNQLTTLRLLNTSVVELADVNAFSGCSVLTRIEVPSDLVESYKSDSKWQNFSSKIYAASVS